MKNFRLWMLAAILTLCGTMNALAQIDPKISEILRKCEQAMTNPRGIEMQMTIDVKMVVKLSGSTVTMASKGDKMKSTVVMKVLGKEMKMESGFDGMQKWKFRKALPVKKEGKETKDTLTIEKVTKKPKGKFDIDFDMDKDYKTATLKQNGRFYELTFTNPKDKDDPSKVVMKIDKEKYYFCELRTKDSGATMTMKVTKITIGVSDDVFKLNLNDYPGAVIVRK